MFSCIGGSTITIDFSFRDSDDVVFPSTNPLAKIYDENLKIVKIIQNINLIDVLVPGEYRFVYTPPVIYDPVVYIVEVSGTVGGNPIIERYRLNVIFIEDEIVV